MLLESALLVTFSKSYAKSGCFFLNTVYTYGMQQNHITQSLFGVHHRGGIIASVDAWRAQHSTSFITSKTV